jgi:hypothetical protein
MAILEPTLTTITWKCTILERGGLESVQSMKLVRFAGSSGSPPTSRRLNRCHGQKNGLGVVSLFGLVHFNVTRRGDIGRGRLQPFRRRRVA